MTKANITNDHNTEKLMIFKKRIIYCSKCPGTEKCKLNWKEKENETKNKKNNSNVEQMSVKHFGWAR